MSAFSPSHRTRAAAALRRACAALAHVSLVRSAVVATTLMLGACTERSLPTTPVAASVPAGPSRLLITTPVSYADVSAGAYHTCAVNTLGVLTCWGRNSDGQATVPATAQSGIAHVSAGLAHTCAVSTAGALTCWGSNSDGQTTVPDAATSGIAQVSAGGYHTCALSTTGTVTCWGANTAGQSAVPGTATNNMIQVSAGALHTCAITNGTGIGYPNRSLRCWGGNADGQVPGRIGIDSGYVYVSAGVSNTCVLKWSLPICVGANGSGQNNEPSGFYYDVAQISVGRSFTCAVGKSGAASCWGDGTNGKTSVPPAAQSGIAQVSAGYEHACARSTTGVLTCWGLNTEGQTTLPSTTTHVLPTATFSAPTAPVINGQSFTLTLTNAQVSDYPAATTFTYAFDCGSGTFGAATTGNSATCPTTATGSLTVRGKVIDQDGDASTYSASVTVLSAAQLTTALRALVVAATLTPDLRPGLTAKLDDALKALAAGKRKAACSALADFANQVQAQRDKAIPVATADLWLAQVAAIRSAAGC